MFYRINFNCVEAHDYDSINIVQDKDPRTQQPFKSEEEASLWIVSHLKDMYELDIIDVDIEILNELEEPVSEIKTSKETIIRLTSESPINGLYEINVIVPNKENIKTLEFEFINGVATTKTIFRNTGEFLLLINNIFEIEENKYIVFCDESKYILKVV